MLDVHEMRPQDCEVIAANVRFAQEDLRRTIVAYAAHRSSKMTSMYLDSDDPRVLFDVAGMSDEPFGTIAIDVDEATTIDSITATALHCSFGIRLFADDISQINYLLLECHSQSAKKLGGLLGRSACEGASGKGYRFYVMLIDPTLHRSQHGSDQVLQMVACMPNHMAFTPATLAREAGRQLLNAA